MSLFSNPQVHEQNPPDTWLLVRFGPREWVLTTRSGVGTLGTFTAKRAALEAKRSGFLVNLYADEGRWFAGERVRGWKPYVPEVSS